MADAVTGRLQSIVKNVLIFTEETEAEPVNMFKGDLQKKGEALLVLAFGVLALAMVWTIVVGVVTALLTGEPNAPDWLSP